MIRTRSEEEEKLSNINLVDSVVCLNHFHSFILPKLKCKHEEERKAILT